MMGIVVQKIRKISSSVSIVGLSELTVGQTILFSLFSFFLSFCRSVILWVFLCKLCLLLKKSNTSLLDMEICARDLGHVLRTSLDTRRSVVAKESPNGLLLINHGILLMLVR